MHSNEWMNEWLEDDQRRIFYSLKSVSESIVNIASNGSTMSQFIQIIILTHDYCQCSWSHRRCDSSAIWSCIYTVSRLHPWMWLLVVLVKKLKAVFMWSSDIKLWKNSLCEPSRAAARTLGGLGPAEPALSTTLARVWWWSGKYYLCKGLLLMPINVNVSYFCMQ